MNQLLRRLIADGDYAQAYATWRKAMPAAPRAQALRNGDFAHAPDGTPFDWVLQPTLGADVAIVAAPDADGKALQIEFSGARVRFDDNVKQLVLLPPGAYTFTVDGRAHDLRTKVGLQWRVICAGKDGRSLGRSSGIAGEMPWSEQSIAFEVPAEGCPAQWLALGLPARFDFERQIEGTVWFAGARIATAARSGT